MIQEKAKGKGSGRHTGAALVRTRAGVDDPQYTASHIPAVGNTVLAKHFKQQTARQGV